MSQPSLDKPWVPPTRRGGDVVSARIHQMLRVTARQWGLRKVEATPPAFRQVETCVA